MKNRFRKILAGIVTFAVLGVTAAVPAFAADKTDTGTGSVTGNVTINGSISPLTISVTHSVNVAYAISPDAETFTAPDITVTNNTKVAVIATVESLKAASGGTLTFTDVDPSAKAWRSLNLADSKKYIALGIAAKGNSGWNSGYSTSTHWAVNDSPLQVGTLNPNTSGALSLTADYGLAFDGAYTANHQLVFQFQLAENKGAGIGRDLPGQPSTLKGGFYLRQSFRWLFLVPLLAAGVLLSGASPAFAASAAPVLTLTATPNPSGNYVALNWTNSDKSQPYSYMLYSKSAHESTFQSIPAKDNAKVLNIYPVVDPTVSFTTWQGKSYTLPKSASLKMWMEAPNEYDSKGYGKGLISVDTVSISDFNANPDAYLKNADGSYKYDVLYFGAWDNNNLQDLSATAETGTDAFIKTGRGVCFGHDTLVSNDAIANPNFFKLAHYVNIETINHYTPLGGSEISVTKKGLLTNYPWNIGGIGTALTVPTSNSNSQIALGDIWMAYQPPYPYCGGVPQSDSNGKGTNNFYLTTWSNCALIQTGHSDGEATPDEQRVTANTLFYLAQITTDTSWNDHKGQDLDAPDEPVISGVTHNSDRTQYTVSYSSQDNATGYQYYVEATGQNDGAKYDSPVISTTLKTGMKGYSIVVDDKPDTVPDGSITTTANSYTFSRPSGSSFYVHIAAVDNAGNISAVTHYQTNELVSVTHPVSIGYAIDPNSNTPFTAPDIPITNHSTFPVRVSVAGLKAIFGIGDAAPTSYSDWNSLTAAQTGSGMALGVGISKTAGSGWTAVDRTTPVYTDDLASEVSLGTLGANGASGNLALTAKFGLAWANAKTVSHELTLDFTIAD